ncbi:hypothetical protein GJ496_000328 [Pomphorhynchus laevis]|nr:hypothetical protein GJ496_011120 [Pomphorhynchus laevis]KAI0989108.1 hypothetical protein GJ496_000328 [Pomphorhynchus laevis]
MTNFLSFLLHVGQLKRTYRVGWLVTGLSKDLRVESIAEHSFRVAMMAMCFTSSSEFKTLDRQRCVEMAMIHDLAESIIGDLCPFDDQQIIQRKPQLELEAMQRICGMLPDAKLAEYVMELFTEFEEKQTDEALAVKDCDLLDMIMQACEYELLGNQKSDLKKSFTRDSVLNKLTNQWAKDHARKFIDSVDAGVAKLPKDSNTETYYKFN